MFTCVSSNSAKVKVSYKIYIRSANETVKTWNTTPSLDVFLNVLNIPHITVFAILINKL